MDNSPNLECDSMPQVKGLASELRSTQVLAHMHGSAPRSPHGPLPAPW
jgi:hypothetical protein